MSGTDVIVGIDGTTASDTALQWAVAEAARCGARLKIVMAAPRIDEWTTLTVAAAVDAARKARPGLQVTGRTVPGQPADVLTALAADAALVVVGCHDRTALAEAVRGATGIRVAMRAVGRVVVVRGRADADEGPVAVGIDGSHTDNRLLAAAFEHAARRGCEVVAVRAVPPPTGPWGVGIPPPVMSEGAVVVGERTAVPEIVDAVERCRARTVAVVDGFGRLLGAIDPEDYPDLFQSYTAYVPRVAGSRRQRDRQARTGRCTARDLMSPFPVLNDTCRVDEAVRSLDDIDADVAIVVNDLGCVVGTVTRLTCRAVVRTLAPCPTPALVPLATATRGR